LAVGSTSAKSNFSSTPNGRERRRIFCNDAPSMGCISIATVKLGSSAGWPRAASSLPDQRSADQRLRPLPAGADRSAPSRSLRPRRAPSGGPPGLCRVHHQGPDAESDREGLGDGEHGNQHSANLRSRDGLRYRDQTLSIPWRARQQFDDFGPAGRRSRRRGLPGDASAGVAGRVGDRRAGFAMLKAAFTGSRGSGAR